MLYVEREGEKNEQKTNHQQLQVYLVAFVELVVAIPIHKAGLSNLRRNTQRDDEQNNIKVNTGREGRNEARNAVPIELFDRSVFYINSRSLSRLRSTSLTAPGGCYCRYYNVGKQAGAASGH